MTAIARAYRREPSLAGEVLDPGRTVYPPEAADAEQRWNHVWQAMGVLHAYCGIGTQDGPRHRVWAHQKLAERLVDALFPKPGSRRGLTNEHQDPNLGSTDLTDQEQPSP